MTPELQKDLDAVSIALVRPMALEGLPVEKATAEFRKRLQEMSRRHDLSPTQISFLCTRFERWVPEYAKQWAAGYAKGYAKGRSRAILRVLKVRTVPVADSVRARIVACTDLDTLGRWLDRADTATTADDLFAAEPVAPG